MKGGFKTPDLNPGPHAATAVSNGFIVYLDIAPWVMSGTITCPDQVGKVMNGIALPCRVPGVPEYGTLGAEKGLQCRYHPDMILHGRMNQIGKVIDEAALSSKGPRVAETSVLGWPRSGGYWREKSGSVQHHEGHLNADYPRWQFY